MTRTDVSLQSPCLLNPQGDKHYLFIAYTIADCALCFTEVPFWHELATTFADQLEVVGVVTGSTAEQGAYFAQHRGISIPLVYTEVVQSLLSSGGRSVIEQVALQGVRVVQQEAQ